jgi:hypothetical protein
MNRVWVLGPHSPSMMAISDLLDRCQEVKKFALVNGARPTALNSQDMTDRNSPDMEKDQVYTVDCSFKMPKRWDVRVSPKEPDNEPAQNFMSASLIGQTISILANLGVLNIHDPPINITAGGLASFGKKFPEIGEFFLDNMWRVFVGTIQNVGISFVVPIDYVYVAASERCLEEAYCGKCASIDGLDFCQFRCRQKAAYYTSVGQSRSSQSVANDIVWACQALDRADNIGIPSNYLAKDMRNASDLPELREAALAHGYAYIAYEPLPGIDPKILNEHRREAMRKARAAGLEARRDLILKMRTGQDFLAKEPEDDMEGPCGEQSCGGRVCRRRACGEHPSGALAEPPGSEETARRRIILDGRTTPEMLRAFDEQGLADKMAVDANARDPEAPGAAGAILKPISPSMRKTCALLMSETIPIEVVRLVLALLHDLPSMGQKRSLAIGMIQDFLASTSASELAPERNAFRLPAAQDLLMEILDATTLTKEDLSILGWELEQLGLELVRRTTDKADHR